MDADFHVVGERELSFFLEQLPERLLRAIPAEELAGKLAAAVRAAEPRRTGKLRSETQPFVHRDDTSVSFGVRVDASTSVEHGKAGALEYGAHRPTTVHEHWATRSNFWGRYAQPESVLIEEYTRRVNIPEDRYLRGPFEAFRNEIIVRTQAALDEAAKTP